MEAYISEIQQFCVHDGPGIRTVVFFQGCPLKCKWCQNPETISSQPVHMYNKTLCSGCGACAAACTSHALTITKDQEFKLDLKKCCRCGCCVAECYFRSRTFSSSKMTVDQVYQEVMKDEVVFRNSGGGITLSGGEALLQKEFNLLLLNRIKAQGISTAVETAGYLPFSTIESFARLVDTFLYDLKLMDEGKHKYWVGVSNQRILSNLKRLTDIHENVVIRIPLIPGVNDTEEFERMIGFLQSLRKINGIHILPFHNAGAGKYDWIGEEYTLLNLNENNSSRVEACRKLAECSGFRVSVGGSGFVSDKNSTMNKEHV